MPTTPLFPLPEGLEITAISEATEEVIVRVTSARRTRVLPTLFYPFFVHSQLLPPETTRSALCWPPHSFVSERTKVLLPQP